MTWHQQEIYGHAARDSGSHRYLAPVIRSLCHKYAVRTVLDVGCGNGALCRDLHLQGFKVVGVEPSADGYAIAAESSPGVSMYRAGVEELTHVVEESSFDLVVCAEVVEHLFDPTALPRAAAEKLRPGGWLVVTTPYHGYLKNLVLAILGKWDTHHQPLNNGGHIKFWSRKTIQRLLEDHGFHVVEFRGVGRLPYLWKSMAIVARRNLSS